MYGSWLIRGAKLQKTIKTEVGRASKKGWQGPKFSYKYHIYGMNL